QNADRGDDGDHRAHKQRIANHRFLGSLPRAAAFERTFGTRRFRNRRLCRSGIRRQREIPSSERQFRPPPAARENVAPAEPADDPNQNYFAASSRAFFRRSFISAVTFAFSAT